MSTAEKRYRHYSRTFLNLPGEHGLAAALITVSRNPCDGAGFTLSDCNRVVSLDLSMYDEEAIENSLFKAETPTLRYASSANRCARRQNAPANASSSSKSAVLTPTPTPTQRSKSSKCSFRDRSAASTLAPAL